MESLRHRRLPRLSSSVLAAACVTLLAAAPWGNVGAAQAGPVQSAESATAQPGRILPNWIEVQGGTQPVSPELVLAMAQRLQDTLEHGRYHGNWPPTQRNYEAADYTVQYQGSADGSVRLLGVCRSFGPDTAALDRAFRLIYDGGNCVFEARYAPGEGRFSTFGFHGNG
jgi:hypothetical protein